MCPLLTLKVDWLSFPEPGRGLKAGSPKVNHSVIAWQKVKSIDNDQKNDLILNVTCMTLYILAPAYVPSLTRLHSPATLAICHFSFCFWTCLLLLCPSPWGKTPPHAPSDWFISAHFSKAFLKVQWSLLPEKLKLTSKLNFILPFIFPPHQPPNFSFIVFVILELFNCVIAFSYTRTKCICL